MKSKEITTKDLKRKYKGIVAYCQYMDSCEAWVEQQLWCAFSRNLPTTVVRVEDIGVYSENKEYKTINDLPENVYAGVMHYYN